MTGRHQGKSAIITGCGRGIGLAVARRLAQEGASILAADLDTPALQETAQALADYGGRVVVHPLDVRDPDQTGAMLAAAVAAFGRIDILVNNAGVHATLPILEITPADWDWLQDVNLRGMFFCMQAVARQMVAQIPAAMIEAGYAENSTGKIVNLASTAGRNGRADAAHYAASKAATINLTQSMAKHLAPYGINVNAVCPGVIPTQMWQQIDHTITGRLGLQQGAWMDKTLRERVPLRRAGRVEDVAAVISFLCSADADYITGQALNVDGGMEMN